MFVLDQFQIDAVSDIKSNNKKAFVAIGANEELIPSIRKNVEDTLKDLVGMLDEENIDE